MTRIDHVAVVVPAANEQRTVTACLDGLLEAMSRVRASRAGLTVELVVVLDRCTDLTGDLVAATPGVAVVTSDAGCVGDARRQGPPWPTQRAPCALRHVWTAHTDADSVVAPDWLVGQLEHAERGAAVVLGTVRPDLEEPTLSRWLDGYGDRDGHRHVHAANLGIRADVLSEVGGWGRLTQHEDIDLVARVEAAGHRIARIGGAGVRTSGRRRGRTPGGFAGYLRTLDARDDPDGTLV